MSFAFLVFGVFIHPFFCVFFALTIDYGLLMFMLMLTHVRYESVSSLHESRRLLFWRLMDYEYTCL